MDVLNAMRVFQAVVEEGSFTAAADKMNLSNAAVSKTISQLEDHLGGRLLNRTTRRLSLTDSGSEYFDRCRDIIENIQLAEDSVGALNTTPRGVLRVNAPLDYGIDVLPEAMSQFLGAHHEVTLDLVLSDNFVNLVDEGYDVVLRIATRLEDSSLIARRLHTVPIIIVGAPAYLKNMGYPKHPSDFSRHSCLQYSLVSNSREWTFRVDGEVIRVPIGGRLRVNNGKFLVQQAIQGYGLALIPEFLARPYLQSGELVLVNGEWEMDQAEVYALYPRTRHISAKVRAFVDHMVVWCRTYDQNDVSPMA